MGEKNDSLFENYLKDLVFLILELTEEPPGEGDEFSSGRHAGLFEVVSLMQHQADAFGISRSSIGLPQADLD